MFLSSLVSFAFVVACQCKIYDSVSDLPGTTYDFVVVGGQSRCLTFRIVLILLGGLAGSVVASRISENPEWSVLVLEEGVTYVAIILFMRAIHIRVRNEGVVESEAPLLVTEMLTHSIWSWNYSTTPQPGLNGRVIPYQRARILGGCSAHSEYAMDRLNG